MSAMRIVRIGSRGSVLALTQTGMVRDALRRKFPKIHFNVVVIQTRGDRDQSLSVFDHRQTGIFTREIEKHLLSGNIDIAVHSLKDLPTALPAGLELGAYYEREDPGDCLISRDGKPLKALKRGARVGTASIRRELQLLNLRPDLKIMPLRGNLTTRINRVLRKELDAVVVAQAGIDRLGTHRRLAHTFRPQEMLPCVGQGILGIEIRKKDRFTRGIVARINHLPSQYEGVAERALLAALHGGCRVPIGALARCDGKRLLLQASVLSASKKTPLHARGAGKNTQAAAIGRAVAKQLLKSGAARYIDEARTS